MEIIEAVFWSLLVGGIWFGAFYQNRRKNTKELDDFLKYKY